MITRRRVIALLILLGILASLLWLSFAKRRSPDNRESKNGEMVAKETVVSKADGRAVEARVDHAAVRQSDSKNEQEQRDLRQVAQVTSLIEASNVPIQFWGKVIDQNGAPLNAVKVAYSYTTEHGAILGAGWSSARYPKGEINTDDKGLFLISGISGTYLNIDSLTKQGYASSNRLSPSGATFNYLGRTSEGKFVPRQNDPKIFVLVQRDAQEPLIHYRVKLNLPGNGTVVRFSLGAGRIDPSGELELTLHRNPSQVTVGQAFRWDMAVAVLAGGVEEMAQKGSSYIAPEGDYALEGIKWTFKTDKAFFLKTSTGKFARVNITIYPDDEGLSGRCYIEGYFNPSGSRNLEYDPQLEIVPH